MEELQQLLPVIGLEERQDASVMSADECDNVDIHPHPRLHTRRRQRHCSDNPYLHINLNHSPGLDVSSAHQKLWNMSMDMDISPAPPCTPTNPANCISMFQSLAVRSVPDLRSRSCSRYPAVVPPITITGLTNMKSPLRQEDYKTPDMHVSPPNEPPALQGPKRHMEHRSMLSNDCVKVKLNFY